jgi:hypothetical protein
VFLNPLNSPSAVLVRLAFAAHVARLRRARDEHDRGASAIELAIITAILVGLAAAVLLVITNIVTNRSNEINTKNSTVP